jgi:predicted PurR-regulated permease PerM
MSNQKVQIGFFVSLLLVILIASFFVVIPYLVPILLAGIFAVIFYPLHKIILNFFKNKKTLSAIISVLIILNIVVVPLMFFAINLFGDLAQFYSKIASNGGIAHVFSQTFDKINLFVKDILPFEIGRIQDVVDIDSQINTAMQWILTNFSTLLSHLFLGVLDFFVFVLGLFYFLRDGNKLQSALLHISPLRNTDDSKIVNKLKNTINSIVRGGLIVAVVQGLIVGLGFAIFGIPNPTIWAFLTTIFAFIPGLGPILIIGPAIIYSVFALGIISTIGLICLAFISIVLIDNTLSPLIMSKSGVEIHPFIILVSILGGIKFLGPIGFIAGPMITSLFFTLLEIYPMLVEKKEII